MSNRLKYTRLYANWDEFAYTGTHFLWSPGVTAERSNAHVHELMETGFFEIYELAEPEFATNAAGEITGVVAPDGSEISFNRDSILTDGSFAVPKTAGTGIKVDLDIPTFGWRDLTSSVDVRGVGANDPTFAVYGATTIRAYQFSATTMQEVFFVYHVPHDWVPGTDIFFHAHWSNAAATPNTGNVVWGFDYSFAKGFNQEAFPAVQTVKVTQVCPATRYQHMVAETAAVTIPTMEVDGLILVRCWRDATVDTCTDAVFLHTSDIHYQSSNMATKNKAPSFYA